MHVSDSRLRKKVLNIIIDSSFQRMYNNVAVIQFGRINRKT